MIVRDAVPTSHTPPLPRIDVGQVIEPNPHPTVAQTPVSLVEAIEQARIMDLIRQTATGTNPPMQVDDDGPTEITSEIHDVLDAMPPMNIRMGTFKGEVHPSDDLSLIELARLCAPV